jgi:hypothetical protein
MEPLSSIFLQWLQVKQSRWYTFPRPFTSSAKYTFFSQRGQIPGIATLFISEKGAKGKDK